VTHTKPPPVSIFTAKDVVRSLVIVKAHRYTWALNEQKHKMYAGPENDR